MSRKKKHLMGSEDSTVALTKVSLLHSFIKQPKCNKKINLSHAILLTSSISSFGRITKALEALGESHRRRYVKKGIFVGGGETQGWIYWGVQGCAPYLA